MSSSVLDDPVPMEVEAYCAVRNELSRFAGRNYPGRLYG